MSQEMVESFLVLCWSVILSHVLAGDLTTSLLPTTTSRTPGAPYFTEPPFNKTVLVDEEFTLPCRVAGTPTPEIKWWNAYTEMRRRGTAYRILRSGNLRFTRILPQHEGYYRCQGNNTNGKIISNYAFLQVDAPATIVNGPTERDVKEGATVYLKCEGLGKPMPVVSWKVDGQILVDADTHRPYNKSFYVFNATVTQRYECWAENKYKKVVQAANVTVSETPKGRCEVYSGKICRHHLGSRMVWYNLSSQANASTLELKLLSLWKQLVSSVSTTCRPAAEALFCDSVYPSCDNSTGIPLPVKLCREHCTVIERQFCYDSWDAMNVTSVLFNITLPTCRHLYSSHRSTKYRPKHALQSCSRVREFEVDPSQITSECYHDRGHEYSGDTNVTEQQLPCQRWADHKPHSHPQITHHVFHILKGADNHCRNPGGLRARPWCYVNVTSVDEQWQYCDIPQCVRNESTSRGLHELEKFFTKDTIIIVVVAALVTVSLIILIVLLCYRVYQQKYKIHYNRASQSDFTIDVEKLACNLSYHQQPEDLLHPPPLQHVEYPRNDIVFVKDIGQGAFGRMFKAKAPNIMDDHDSTTVVVKMLKEDASDDMELDFEREAALLVELDHPNIIKLLGACAIGKPQCLLFEYMSKGDLNEYLRNSSPDHFIVRNRSTEVLSNPQDRPKLDYVQQLEISKQLASAMVYLSEKRYVHRDLATRNCLVGDDLVVKISDFGLTCRVEEDEGDVYIGSDHDAIPIRWMPLEAILYNQFTFESDVWSFGVVLWEIFSFALQPYYDMEKLDEVIKYINEGHILSCPDNTPQEVYDIMKMCWKLAPHERPPFHYLYEMISDLQEDMRHSRRVDRV